MLGRLWRRRRVVTVAVACVALTAGLIYVLGPRLIRLYPDASPSPTFSPVQPADVGLEAQGAPEELVIGVVVTPSSQPGEGSDWVAAAEGAQVAAYRFSLGEGTQVSIEVADDQGTAEGARAAVDRLGEAGASGVVMATSGTHVAEGLDQARALGLPVLLPYESDAEMLSDMAGQMWLTGPGAPVLDRRMGSALKDIGVSAPLMVDAGGGQPTSIDAVSLQDYTEGEPTQALRSAVTRAARQGSIDSLVVTGPASAQAAVVHAFQSTGVDLPVVLGPEALSPRFPAALTDLGASLEGQMVTVGVADSDPAALSADEGGEALSAYLAAVRLLAGDAEATDLFDAAPFTAQAVYTADAASHDAVVALVRAAGQAGSTDPGQVTQSLRSMKVTHADGLAGPELDFTVSTALPAGATTTLSATSQDPGLRDTDTAEVSPTLFWFATDPA